MEEEMVKLKVIDKINETSDTVLLNLTIVSTGKFSFRAGQFLTLIFPSTNKELRRSYSICSIPEELPNITIIIKRIDNGEISRLIHHTVQKGDILLSLIPSGKFYIEDITSISQKFFFAAGSGIAPIFSIIKDQLSSNNKAPLHLIYSSRSRNETIFYQELEALKTLYKGILEVEYIFSDPSPEDQGLQGHLQFDLVQKLVEKYRKYVKQEIEFYICGPFNYMRMVETILVVKGYDPQKIRKENFVSIGKPSVVLPIAEKHDLKERNVTIDINSSEFQITVPAGTNILDAVLRKGINLPYSCKAGICGTCSAICLQGKVIMSINDVLTGKDLERGWILTCTGYPATDVHLKFER